MNTKKALLLAFALLMGMMLILIFIGLFGMQVINRQLEGIARNNLVKVVYTSNMLHAARERSILLHRMVLSEDPFERDEMAMELDVHGAHFGNNRIPLLAMPLTSQEEKLLKTQGGLTSIAIPLQRKVIDLVAGDRLEEAEIALIEEAMPAQDAVLRQLTRLITLQENYAEEATLNATDTYGASQRAIFLLGGGVVLFSIIIAMVSTRRIAYAENRLTKEKEKAQVTLRSIGDAVITTGSNGLIEYVNHKAEKLIGLFADEIVGRKVAEVFKAIDVDNQKKIAEFVDQELSGAARSRFQAMSSLNLTMEASTASA